MNNPAILAHNPDGPQIGAQAMDRAGCLSPTANPSRRPHYMVLDGLRGTAALAIVVFHFSEFVFPNYARNPLGHGFLAVDFFFCLSGFVIGYAYDERLRSLTFREFALARLIRLHPLVVLGAGLGLLAFIFDPYDGGRGLGAGLPRLALALFCSFLLIPMPFLPGRGGGLFPLNTPTWSLFWEYVANVAYFLVLGRMPRRWLAVLVLPCAAGLIAVAWRAGTLVGGWGIDNIWDGLPRVAFSFLAGLLIHRFGVRLRARLGFFALSVVLLGALMLPYGKANWLVETAVVVMLFPLIVACGAGAEVSGWRLRLCDFLGRLSYPLYMTHNMVMFPFGGYHAEHPLSGRKLFAALSVGTLILAGFATLAMKFYDEPIRVRLQQRFLKPRA